MPRLPRLRTRLLTLATLSTLPIVLLSIALAWALVDHEQATVLDAAIARNRTLLSAVDAQIEGELATMRLLASSPALKRGDLPAFAEEARNSLASQPYWRDVLLVAEGGQQLTNARAAPGQALPHEIDSEVAIGSAAIASGQPHVGDVVQGPLSHQPGIPMQMPVALGPDGHAILKVILEPAGLSQLMARQNYPASWALGVVDSTAHFIARLPPRAPGQAVSKDMGAAMRRSPSGWFLGRTLEGTPSYSAYAKSTLTGWTVSSAIPAAVVRAPAWRATVAISLGTLASLAIALALGLFLSRRLASPIARIAHNARRLTAGQAPEPWPTRDEAVLREVLDLAIALEAAYAAVAERESLLKREQDALRAADTAKDEFLAMLGHELRNPLNAIVASAHVLRLSGRDSRAFERANEVIERQSRQMTRLVEDLLDISRLAMGKTGLKLGRLDLGALVSSVADTWQASGRMAAGRLVTRVAPVWVDGDRARLEQVVTNLIDNASKFSAPEAPIEVIVRQDGPEAILEVVDQGKGIPSHDLERIFERFFQGEQSADRPHGGLGLGLSLVQRLATLHGGSVSAHSEGAGRGARLVLRLPASSPADQALAVPVAGARSARRRVLLVEDSDDGRDMVASMLALQGQDVRSVADGMTALAAVSEWRPDVMLIDIGLPDISGYEVARRVQAMGLPVLPCLIALTGLGQSADERAAYEAGFALHLTKPVDPDFLLKVLEQLVRTN